MHMLEPKQLEKRKTERAKKGKSKRHKRKLLRIIILGVIIYTSLILGLPIPALQATIADANLPAASQVDLPWPSYGQSAVGAVGYGLLASNGDSKPIPIASMAKIITAVAVLKAHPMPPSSKGETITFTTKDVAIYNKYLAEGQSAVAVEAGEKLTQYQALQALLLPSANNMADALVIWAFGSMENYLAFVNPFTKTLGMENTHIADASGFSPLTVSTAKDLAKLAEIAMNQPAIAEIIAQPQADLPVAGIVYNVNNLLGSNGIVGIKTGNTDQAGGCFMFAAKRDIGNANNVTVVGVVMGAPFRAKAMDDSLPLINATFENFKITNPIADNSEVGVIVQPNGVQVPIKIGKSIPVIAWTGQALRSEFVANKLKTSINAGDTVGTLTLHAGNMSYDMPVVSGGTIAPRSLFWRLMHGNGRF